MPDLSLGQIEDDINYNFQSKYDEDQEIYEINAHSCKYYEISEFNTKLRNNTNSFSIYSHNVRSLNGHWDNLTDIFNSLQPFKFSVIALQEIWSINRNYELDGYGKFEYVTRDKKGPPNLNCGGGVGIFIESNYKEYEILKDESFFILLSMNLSG